MTEKLYLREAFSKKRLDFVKNYQKPLDSVHLLLSRFLSELLGSEKKMICAVYSARDFEAKILMSCFDSHITWAYPKVRGRDLDFYIHSQLEDNELGFKEPREGTGSLIDVSCCHAVVVPGLSFDKRGHRLGSGQGFYDRALKHYKGLKVGLCFSEQISNDNLPYETHDVFMDYIVTEKDILKIKTKNEGEKRWIF